ncbi:C-type lectin domain family 11 member A [Pelodytes ibericus]
MFFGRILLILLCLRKVPTGLSEDQKDEKSGEVKTESQVDTEENIAFQKTFLNLLMPFIPGPAITYNVTVVSVKQNQETSKEEEQETDYEEEGIADNQNTVVKERIPSAVGPTPTPAADDNLSYVLSRINTLEAAIHRLNVQFHGMDVKMSRMSESLSKTHTKVSETEDTLATVSEMNLRNQRHIGQIEGCLKGKRLHRKCYLIFQHFETYATAQKLCHSRGGNLAMPIDQQDFAALTQYVHDAFFPFNWPIWIGINDLRSEGMYLYENGHRVSFYNWYKDHLVTQPNGGAVENCVSISSDDGKWWDNDCSRRMYYVCEY